MGIRIRIGGLKIGSSSSGSGSSWTPALPLGGETPDLWTTSRSGLALVDTVNPANNPVITLPSLQQSNNPLIVVDNGGLDVGAAAGDFTFAVRCKSNSAVKTSYPTIGGKGIDGSLDGMYYIYQNITTGYLRWVIKGTGAAKDTLTNVDFTAAGWVLLIIEIDKTASVGRFFINGSQVGADVAYTGTWPAMANQYEFLLGISNNQAGNAFNYTINAIYSEAWVLNRKLTPTEKTTITNYGHLADLTNLKGHWITDNITPRDLSGNGYHMATNSGASNTSIVYDSGGSRYLLDKGYSLYKYSGSSILRNIFVGYNGDVPLATPSLPAGYTKELDHAGSLTTHNLADSKLTFVGDNWSRDNATIYGDMARQTLMVDGDGSWYVSGTPKVWHISELNRVKLNTFFNTAYKGILFPKITNNSIDDRQVLTEIFSYATNKTGSDYTKAITYTGDHGHSWDISYYFSEVGLEYRCARGNKMLAFDGTDTFSLSLDGGGTYPISKQIVGFAGPCEFTYIFENGNILIASKVKMYLSTDNLTNIAETTVTDVGGGAYTPGASQNFMCFNPIKYMSVEGTEIFVWGNYSIVPSTDELNARLWYTVDSGVTVKCFYRYNGVILAKHTEEVSQDSVDETLFRVTTGDNDDGKVNLLNFTYTKATDTWSAPTKINTVAGDDHENPGDYHFVGHGYYGSYFYMAKEDVFLTGSAGVYRALLSADFSDKTIFKKLVKLNRTGTGAGYFIAHGKIMICAEMTERILYISNDGLNFYPFKILGGPDPAAFEGEYFGFDPPNVNGYMRGDIAADGETWANPYQGQTIMLKIVEE
jgi:hypothetical protein